MKHAKGTPVNLTDSILARITKTPRGYLKRRSYFIAGEKPIRPGYAGRLASGGLKSMETGVGGLPESFIESDLHDNDLVLISPNGQISVVWKNNSHQNSLLLTEACDCRCLMCPQLPKKNDTDLLKLAQQILKRLRPDDVTSICLTGGEPSLLKEKLVAIMALIHRKFPGKQVILLTNGKNFSDFSFAKNCAIASGGQVLFCVSLHSNNDRDHDRIVGVPGSFQKTIIGITNLARLGLPIEIRFVINKINVDHIAEFADFCYRNFPFVTHIAFMAMEIRGIANENFNNIWIDPGSYGEEVRFASNRLAMRGMKVSIYNIPLCLLPQEAWPIARQSISGWKNDFLHICGECDVRQQCAGIFTTSSKQSEFLHPIKLNIDNSC